MARHAACSRPIGRPIRTTSHSSSTPLWLAYALAHQLAQALDLGGTGAARVDQEVAVLVGDHGRTQAQPTAASGVDQLPRAMAGRVLERAAAGGDPQRLRRLALGPDLVHAGEHGIRLGRLALEGGPGDDPFPGQGALAVGKAQLARRSVAGQRRADPVLRPTAADPWSRRRTRRRSSAPHRRSCPGCRSGTRARPGPRAAPPEPPADRGHPPRPGPFALPTSTLANGPPNRITTPLMPPSRTSKFEATPIGKTGTSAGSSRRNSARSSASAGWNTASAGPPTRNQVSGAKGTLRRRLPRTVGRWSSQPLMLRPPPSPGRRAGRAGHWPTA